jgi:hypothetical protein
MFDATSETQCVRMKNLLLECLAEEAPAEPAADEAKEEKSS